MKPSFTTFFFLVLVFFISYEHCNAQTIDSISPVSAPQNQTLTTTITTSNITFVPGSPMGGPDIYMQNHNYSYYSFNSNWGTAQKVDANHVTVQWTIPNYVPEGLYDLYVDVSDQFNNDHWYTLLSAFEVGCTTTISATATNTTCGNSNGSINLAVSNGNPPYNYSWNTGATIQNLTNLPQGVYTVTVTDKFCSTTQTVAIGNTNGPSINETHQHSVCGKANGSINTTITGGTSPYTFAWSNGATTQNLSNILAGTYDLTVTDHNNCENLKTVIVPDTNELVLSSASGRYSCNTNTGEVSVLAHGTAPYTYLWSNGSTLDTVVNVPSGSYIVTVTDALGCTTVNSAYTNQVYNYYVYVSGSSPNCSNNGTLTASPSGGNPPYAYLWSSGQTTATATGLSSGNYSVLVTDSTGCQRSGYSSLYSYCTNIITGKIFNDVNGNCIYDSTDAPLPNVSVYAIGGGSEYYGYTDTKGNYLIQVNTSGTYTLITQIGYSYNANECGTLIQCASNSNTLTFNSQGGDTSANNNFGFTGSTGFDLDIHPGWTQAKPGFEIQYWVMPFNASPTQFTDTATVVFDYDPRLRYDYGTPPLPAIVDTIAHTLTWKFTNLPDPEFSFQLRPTANFHVPDTMSVNDNLISNFYIYPYAGDCDTTNNHFYYSDNLLSSHDPNAKQVSPAGGITNADSVLTYTIHFQNTGTDTTNFIIVVDTLSPNLDPTTVRNLASSNNYSKFSISGQGILTWTFNPVYLVDSATNVIASKGFIIFSVKERKNIQPGAAINNNATIYFDYNTGVVTNTVTNTIELPLAIPGIASFINVYPNPTSDNVNIILSVPCERCTLDITDVTGREIMQQLLNGTNSSIDMSGMAAGVYFIRVSTAHETYTSKVVKQ